MKLGVFMSDYRTGADVVDRLSADKLGIIFVGNGIYRATLKEGGSADPTPAKVRNVLRIDRRP